MKQISFFLITISFLIAACDNSTINNGADFEFEATDKENNYMNIVGKIRYQLSGRLQERLSKKYGRQQYKDSILVPVISSISRKILSEFDVIEIYSYRREEIDQKLHQHVRSAFAEYEIEVTNFSIWSVELSDSLKQTIGPEYIVRFETSIGKCSKQTKGVITRIDSLKSDDRLVFYEFMVEDNSHESILTREEDSRELSPGDTLVIEYACEYPGFHRLRK